MITKHFLKIVINIYRKTQNYVIIIQANYQKYTDQIIEQQFIMNHQNSENNQIIRNTNEITVRINHPRLNNIPFNITNTTTYIAAIEQLTNQNFLRLFSNWYFEYRQKPLKIKHLFFDAILENTDTNEITKSIELQLYFNPYDYSTSMHHFQEVCKILKNPKELISILKPKSKRKSEEKGEKQEQGSIQIDKLACSQLFKRFNFKKYTIEQVINPSYKNQFFQSQKLNGFEFVQLFAFSGFNPPPVQAEFNGDLFYIHLKTLDGSDFHITASTVGYFINCSKYNLFNPSISQNKQIYTNLIDLISANSDKFHQVVEKCTDLVEGLQENIQNLDPLRNKAYVTSKSVNLGNQKWIQACDHEHQWNHRKDSVLRELQENRFTTAMDWNKQFLSIKMYYQSRRAEYKEKNSENELEFEVVTKMKKVYSQFMDSAISGAKKIVQGKISPLNYMDDIKKHIYIYNKIFFSIAQDTVFHHNLSKGEDAIPSSSSANSDLNNLENLFHLENNKLNLLHTVIIHYRGSKILAQSIIPGLLSSQLSYLTQYGSIDECKTIQVNPQFHQQLKEVCHQLWLDDNVQAIDQNGCVKIIAISPQIKGIKSMQGDKYLCDLQKLSPRDLNYLGLDNQACVLRQTLIQNFVKDQKIDFNNCALISTNIGTDIKFVESAKTQQQTKLLEQMAIYLKQKSVPRLIAAMKSKTASEYLTDSRGVSLLFHQYGINMRYLGFVINHATLQDCYDIRTCLVRIVLVKSLKHLFKLAIRQTNSIHLNLVVAHLLNCIFSNKNQILYLSEGIEEFEDKIQMTETKKKKKKKNQKDEIIKLNFEQNKLIKIVNSVYLTMKANQVWNLVLKIALSRYNFKFENSLIQFNQNGLFSLGYQKYATLRDLCLTIGLVLQKKQYNLISNFEKDEEMPFNYRNILYFKPISKIININKRAQYASQIQVADNLFNNSQYKQALDNYKCIAKLVQKSGDRSTYGYIKSQIARIHYLLNNIQSAIFVQNQNLLLIINDLREDSLELIKCYSRFGLYFMGLGIYDKALFFLYKGLHLMLISYGESYPDVLINFANIARIHMLNKDLSNSSQCYLKAIQLLSKVYRSKNHVNISFCYSSLATLNYDFGEYKKSSEFQAQTVAILQKVLNEDDPRLQDAMKILNMYKEVARSKTSKQKRR